jgi:hypothetical protein
MQIDFAARVAPREGHVPHVSIDTPEDQLIRAEHDENRTEFDAKHHDDRIVARGLVELFVFRTHLTVNFSRIIHSFKRKKIRYGMVPKGSRSDGRTT